MVVLAEFFQLILGLADLFQLTLSLAEFLFSLFWASQSFCSAYVGSRRVCLAYFGSRRAFVQLIVRVEEFFSAKNKTKDARLGPDQTNVWISWIQDYFWHGRSLNYASSCMRCGPST